MKKKIFILIAFIILISSFSHSSERTFYETTRIPEVRTSNQSKAVFEKNLDLKIAVFKLLYYDSCDIMQDRDYKNMYELLTEEYLNKYFPTIKSAKEYEFDMKNHSKIRHKDYLMIEKVEYIKNDEVKIKLQVELENKGVLQKLEETIIFKEVEGSWKYNGEDTESVKILETKSL